MVDLKVSIYLFEYGFFGYELNQICVCQLIFSYGLVVD